jgi:hypothetical protein
MQPALLLLPESRAPSPTSVAAGDPNCFHSMAWAEKSNFNVHHPRVSESAQTLAWRLID